MGKVKQSKKSYAQPSEDVVRFVDAVATCPDAQLVTLLARLDVWRFSRGDLHGWIPALDRFDAVLEGIVKSYELDKPQLNPSPLRTKSSYSKFCESTDFCWRIVQVESSLLHTM